MAPTEAEWGMEGVREMGRQAARNGLPRDHLEQIEDLFRLSLALTPQQKAVWLEGWVEARASLRGLTLVAGGRS